MGRSQVNMALILLLAGVSSVLGHGGMVWPPIWQDGEALGLEEVYSSNIGTDPPQVDPRTGKEIDDTKSWSTDQAYTYGHGENETLAKTGPLTNNVDCSEAYKYSSWKCAASMAETLTAVLQGTTPGPRDPYAHRDGRTGAGAHGPSVAVPWKSSSQRRGRPSGPEAARCPLAFYQSGTAVDTPTGCAKCLPRV